MATRNDSWRAGGTGRGSYTLVANTATQVPLTLDLAAGATANGFLVRNSAGTTLFSISPDGNITIAGSISAVISETLTGNISLTGTLTVTGATTLNSTLAVAGATTQTGLLTLNNLLRFSGSAAVNDNNYEIGRDSDNNNLRYNIPNTAQHEFTVQGSTRATISETTFAINSNTVIGGTVSINGTLDVSGTVSGGTFLADNGLATAPAFSFTSDTDTGMYRAAANQLGWAVNGVVELTLNATNLSPGANDGNALGVSGTAWADLFLASGSVINFAAGDVTITHSANTLAFAGASSGYTFDAIITGTVAGNTATLTNSNDGASSQVAILQGDRVTMADNDEAYVTMRLSDDAGTQTEVARLTWVATDVNAATNVDGRIDFAVMTAGALADELQLDGTALSPSGNDGLALGTVSLRYSDLYLANGAIIDFNSDVTLTQSLNTLTFTGTEDFVITQQAGTSGTPVALTITGGAHAGITAAAEDIGVNLNFSATKTWAAGAGPLALQREVVIQAPTYDGNVAGALTITDAYTFYVTGAPVDAGGNIVLTRTWAAGFNGNVGFGNGTAALPSISFISDPNTGMYSVAGDQIGWTVNGAVELTLNATNLSPGANDGSALGVSGTAFSDLFLASGAVINFAAGDALLTHSAATLAFTGATAMTTTSTLAVVSALLSGSSFSCDVTSTATSGTVLSAHKRISANPASASSGVYIGNRADSFVTSANGQNLTATIGLRGSQGVVNHQGTGTVTGAAALLLSSNNTGGGTLTNMYGMFVDAGATNNNSTTTNWYGGYITVHPAGGGGTITNKYGFYIESITGGATLNYAIYSAGGQSYHSGNLGIGLETVPDEPLHIQKNTINGIKIEVASSTSASSSIIDFYRSRGTIASPSAVAASDPMMRLRGFLYTDSYQASTEIRMDVDSGVGAAGADAPGRISFWTSPDGSAAPAQRVTILNNGIMIVGGTTNAGYGREGQLLEVNTSANDGGMSMSTWSTDATERPLLDFNRSKSSSIGTYTVVASGDALGAIVWRGANGAGAFESAASIQGFIDGAPGAGDMPGRISFHTTPDGTGASVQRMTLLNSGVLTFGGTNNTAYGRLGQLLELNTTANFGGPAFNTWSATAGEATTLDFNRSKSATIGTHSLVASGDAAGFITFRASDGAAFINAAQIRCSIDGTPGLNDMPGRLIFSVTADGAAAVTQRMTLLNNGVFVIGGTTNVAYGRLGQLFETNTTANYGGFAINTWSATAAESGQLDFNRSKSATIGTHTTVANADSLGIINFRGSEGSAFRSAASIAGEVDAAVDGAGGADMPGRLVFLTTPDGSATLTERMRIGSDGTVDMADRFIMNATSKTLTDAATTLFEVALTAGSMCGGAIIWTIEASDGTDHQAFSGVTTYAAVNKGGVYTTAVNNNTGNDSKAVSAGTITTSWDILTGANKVTLRVTPTGSLTETTYRISYTISNNNANAITIL